MPSHLLPALAQSQKEADEAATAKEKEDEKKKKKVRREAVIRTPPTTIEEGMHKNMMFLVFVVLQLKIHCTCCVAGSVYKI